MTYSVPPESKNCLYSVPVYAECTLHLILKAYWKLRQIHVVCSLPLKDFWLPLEPFGGTRCFNKTTGKKKIGKKNPTQSNTVIDKLKMNQN